MKMFDLVVKNPIPGKSLPRDKYELVITFMHGDADAYTTEQWLFDDPSKVAENEGKLTLTLALNFIDQFMAMGWNEARNFERFLTFTKAEMTLLSDANFMPYDITDGGGNYLASINEVKLFYWNEQSVKYDMEIFEVGTNIRLMTYR